MDSHLGYGNNERGEKNPSNRRNGYLCGEYKANEKFSGKGHAAHICKACSRLSAAEKAEAMARNKMMDFPMRRLSDSEKNGWKPERMTRARMLRI